MHNKKAFKKHKSIRIIYLYEILIQDLYNSIFTDR